MKYYIYQNPADKRNMALKQSIVTQLETIVDTPNTADMILVLGGDGTMIEAIQELHQRQKIFFGVNCGTLWFLLNDITTIQEIPVQKEPLQHITEPFIEATIETTDGEIHEHILIVNDIVINPYLPYYPLFTIHKWGQLIKTIQGSGLIMSSAIWSTGYWANFDGPLIPTGQNNIGIMGNGTGGFKYSLMKWPFPYTITVQARNPIDVYIDGMYTIYKDVKTISFKPSEKTFTLVFTTQDFHEKRLQLHSAKLERFL